MALWKPSLLMSIYNVRLTSVRVKDKACIYNDLRLTPGIGCIAGMRLYYRGRKGAIAKPGVDECYRDITKNYGGGSTPCTSVLRFEPKRN